jgi:BTB/POZ domain/Galactose oxidase, central domain
MISCSMTLVHISFAYSLSFSLSSRSRSLSHSFSLFLVFSCSVKNTWKLLEEKAPPSARRCHASVVYGDSLYVFGGATGSSYECDLWAFNFSMLLSLLSLLSPVVCYFNIFFFLKYIRAIYFIYLIYFCFVFYYLLFNLLLFSLFHLFLMLLDAEKEPEPQSTVTEDLQKMLNNTNFYPDVTFKVGSKTIQAHKCILSARCFYFDSYVFFFSLSLSLFFFFCYCFCFILFSCVSFSFSF